MDDLDTWLVQSIIHSKGCSAGVLYDPRRDANRLLDMLLVIADDFFVRTFGRGMGHGGTEQTEVFMVDDGAPEFFVFTDLRPPVIWYSKAYIAKHLQFREIIMAEKGPAAGIGNMFEILGNFYMSLKNETFARTCLLQSLIEMPARLDDAMYYEQMLQLAHVFCLTDQPADGAEASIIALYFGLAHELGHVYGPDTMVGINLQSHPMNLDREALSKALLGAGRDIHIANDCAYAYGHWSTKAQQGFDDPRSIFNIDSLRSEIMADWVGVQILIRFIEFMAARRGRSYNKKIFISELVIGLFILQLIEQCRNVAKQNLTRTSAVNDERKDTMPLSVYFPFEFLQKDDMERTRLANMETLIDFSSVHRTRVGFLKPTLATYALLHLFPDTYLMKEDVVLPRVSSGELARRESVALSNVEGYFNFYHKEFMKLLLTFGDVSLFSAHLVTDSPPPLERNPEGGKGLSEAIVKNFGLHLDRLKAAGEPGQRRIYELLNQISRYLDIVRLRGITDEVLLDAHKRLTEAYNHS